jgi:AraC-like DNA-binding protein
MRGPTDDVPKPSLAGFERLPAGRLLRQIIDLTTDMGVAYERSVGFHKDFHTHERDLLVFPRGACRMTVRTRSPEDSYTITSSHVLFVPRGRDHDDIGHSAVYDTIALLPSTRYMTELVQENGLDSDDALVLRRPHKIRRTRWLDDLVERYFFERIVNARSPVGCVFFLEKQILNELARIIFSTKLATHGGDVRDVGDDLVSRALRYIEVHLFEEVAIEAICKAVGASAATLLRAFKRDLATTPGRYIKERRLDEAAALLERGDYPVSDVAILVGYEDLSAFTRAFRQRFGSAPAAYRKA